MRQWEKYGLLSRDSAARNGRIFFSCSVSLCLADLFSSVQWKVGEKNKKTSAFPKDKNPRSRATSEFTPDAREKEREGTQRTPETPLAAARISRVGLAIYPALLRPVTREL